MKKAFLDQIKDSIIKVFKNHSYPVAAFDADGTLWPSDVGRYFFQHQIKNHLLKSREADPQKKFNSLLDTKDHRRRALTWLALVMSGFEEREVKKWGKDFLKNFPLKPFAFQQELIGWFLKQGGEVFVVSSSVRWVLEEAVSRCFPLLKKENIIGVETYVEKGVITDKLVEPTPVQDEKVKSLLKKTKGVKPVFAAGNTMSDLALLKSSSVRLAVSAAHSSHFNHSSEHELKDQAIKNGWFVYEQMRD